MYLNYFSLNEAPFSIAVDPRFLFMSARHRDAMAHLLYGVGTGGGFILLSGEVGTGKTTVIRSLLEKMPDSTDIAIILNPALNTTELLATICDELGINYSPGEQSLKVFSDKLHQFLLENYARGRKTVLLIDEAQHLHYEVLEQIRLLTNLETNTEKLLQIILVGQPELRLLLNKPELRQLAQRITARYQLKPLDLNETKDYINHRLAIAGRNLPSPSLFPDSVIKKLHKISRGIPRVINVLCDRMLLGAYGKNKSVVDKTILKQAATEVMGEELGIEQLTLTRSPAAFVFSVTALIMAIGITIFATTYFLRSNQQLSQVPLKTPGNTLQTNFDKLSAISADEDRHLQDQNKSDPIQKAGVISASTSDYKATVESTIWSASPGEALSLLTNVLQIDSINCSTASNTSFRCENRKANSWHDVLEVNRPAVLTLTTSAKLRRYGVLLGLSDTHAVLYHQGGTKKWDLEELGRQWTGEFTFIWQPPSFYHGPVSQGVSSELVLWLATQFSNIDKQDDLLANHFFNDRLEQRVKIFQSGNNLKADGVVGLNTLLALNEHLGIARTIHLPTTKTEIGGHRVTGKGGT